MEKYITYSFVLLQVVIFYTKIYLAWEQRRSLNRYNKNPFCAPKHSHTHSTQNNINKLPVRVACVPVCVESEWATCACACNQNASTVDVDSHSFGRGGCDRFRFLYSSHSPSSSSCSTDWFFVCWPLWLWEFSPTTTMAPKWPMRWVFFCVSCWRVCVPYKHTKEFDLRATQAHAHNPPRCGKFNFEYIFIMYTHDTHTNICGVQIFAVCR